MKSPNVVVPGQSAKPARSEPALGASKTISTLAVLLGCLATVVGWTDILLVWYPIDFGNPEWEFGTISTHFDALPLGTIGITILAATLMSRGWLRTARIVGAAALLIALVSLGAYLIYLLDIPVALRGVSPQLAPVIKKAIVKTSILAVCYVAYFALMGMYVWRSAIARRHQH